MKKIFLIAILIPLTSFASIIECNYDLSSGESISLRMKSFKENPSGSYIKSFELQIGGHIQVFTGSDFKLATMRWDDIDKWYLGALIQKDDLKFNFIHVGPGQQSGQWSILDFGSEIAGIPPARYEPMGFCRLL